MIHGILIRGKLALAGALDNCGMTSGFIG